MPQPSKNPLGIDPARAANAPIAGYAYQFDKTTLEILKASDIDTLTVEGVEDIDLASAGEGTAIQCKYHEAGKFSLAAIRKPLRLMLEGFAAGRTWNYRLYVHFGEGEDELPQTLSAEELKSALTEKKRNPARTVRHYEKHGEDVLRRFVQRLRIEAGPSFADQRQQVMTALSSALGASHEDVRDLHYADAFVTIMGMAMKADPAERTITRPAFVAELDKRQAMFTRWHRELLGHTAYLSAVAKQLKAQGITKTTTRRALILGAHEVASGSGTTSVSDLVTALASTGFGPGKLSAARPWTVVLEASMDVVREIKAALVGQSVMFHDGFEDLAFNAELFDRGPLINTRPNGSRIAATAYDLRVLRFDTYAAHAGELEPPGTLLTFRSEPVEFDFAGPAPRGLHVVGCDIEQIADLLGVYK